MTHLNEVTLSNLNIILHNMPYSHYCYESLLFIHHRFLLVFDIVQLSFLESAHVSMYLIHVR